MRAGNYKQLQPPTAVETADKVRCLPDRLHYPHFFANAKVIYEKEF